MEFEKIVVVESNKDSSEHLESSRRLREVLSGRDFCWTMYDDLSKEKLSGADLVITLGGDGTYIEAANRIRDSYLLGINSDMTSSEGALASLSMNERGKLEEILGGKFNVIERQRGEVKLNDKVLDELVTNEVYVGAEKRLNTSRYIIDYRGKREEHRSSGAVISTGTGSTGWFNAIGGDEFGANEKKLRFVITETYLGKRIYVPTVLRGEILSDENISFESTRDYGGIIGIGFKTYDFNRGDVVEVKLSDKPLQSIEGI
ncbi:hypothetical protein HN903_01905 [archaeon]|jgi:NAD+ kinase|nr:hypothetical protein [archaeon]MBT7128487.1 hypothetical protein [archaeon]